MIMNLIICQTLLTITQPRNPGRWGNGLKVCIIIDNKVDQQISGPSTNPGSLNLVVGYGVSVARSNINLPGNGSVNTFTGHLKVSSLVLIPIAQNSNSSIEVRVLE